MRSVKTELAKVEPEVEGFEWVGLKREIPDWAAEE
jgi:hypothetical protein